MAGVGRAQSNDTVPVVYSQSRHGPILREAEWEGTLPRTRAHVAVVVVYRRGDQLVIWPHERKRVLLHRFPVTIYEIDLALHSTAISSELPSQDTAASFNARFHIQWRVFNPSAVVRHQVLNIGEALYATLLHRARAITRDFGVDQLIDAEEKINDKLGGVDFDATAPTRIEQAMQEAVERGCLGAEYGLWTNTIVHLTLDDAAIQHNTKMMKLSWAIKEEKLEQELRIIKNKNEQEITAERIRVYREIVAAGDVEQFALRLSQNPDEITAITTILREDQLTSRRDTIEFISQMVESGVVERWEVSDQVREALEWLREATARVVTNKDHRNVQVDQPLHQRRRGRGAPIEESAPSPDVIVVTAEAVTPDEGTDSKPSP